MQKDNTISIKEFKEIIECVEEFHDAFGIENNKAPQTINNKDFMLRYKLMREENEEYLEACEQGDLTEIADSLGDQLYILCGTILKHGLKDKIIEIFTEIHGSNMSKLDENGQPIYREDGKVLKGANYYKPEIKSILEK